MNNGYYDYKNSTSGSKSGSGGGGCFSWKVIITLAIIYEIFNIIGSCRYG